MILFSLWCKQYPCWLFFLWWILPHNSSHLPNTIWKHCTFPSLKMLAIYCLSLGKAMGNLRPPSPSPCLSSYLSLLLVTSFLPLPPSSYHKHKSLTKASITMYTHLKCVPACCGLGWVLVYYDQAKRKKPCNGTETELQNILPIRSYNWVSILKYW